MTTTLSESVQPLVLPKKSLHDMFGICFDKTETYTITRLSKEDFNNKPITISSILKTSKVKKSSDNEIVIVFSRLPDWSEHTKIEYFNINCNKAVVYHSSYTKKDILEHLKNALEIVVIEADPKSFRYPKHRDDFYVSREFNDDSSLLNRVRFVKLKRRIYNEKTDKDEIEIIPESEIRNYTTNRDVLVKFIGTGEKLRLSMTWGRNSDERWNDVIDKSGYNKKAKLMNNHFKLQEYKANKIKEQIKKNNFLGIQTEISKTLLLVKNEISSLLITLPMDNVKVAQEFLDDLKFLIRDFNDVRKNITEIGTDAEYVGHTLAIPKDLKEITKRAKSLLTEVKKTYIESYA